MKRICITQPCSTFVQENNKWALIAKIGLMSKSSLVTAGNPCTVAPSFHASCSFRRADYKCARAMVGRSCLDHAVLGNWGRDIPKRHDRSLCRQVRRDLYEKFQMPVHEYLVFMLAGYAVEDLSIATLL